jgi:hypothetical protein
VPIYEEMGSERRGRLAELRFLGIIWHFLNCSFLKQLELELYLMPEFS